VTHSLLLAGYEIHGPLYDWSWMSWGIYHPRQIEFARLNLTHTVPEHVHRTGEWRHVAGYESRPVAGLRRRGYTPEPIREFCRRIGIARPTAGGRGVSGDCVAET